MKGELVFIKKTQLEKSGLDIAIDTVFSEMAGYNAHDDEYVIMVDQLTKLYALKQENCQQSVSRDTLVIVLGNLIAVVLIVGHEHTNVVTSKALGFLLKIR